MNPPFTPPTIGSEEEAEKHPLRGRNIEIPEDRYKVDLELHDRYQGYSSELLKLSLGGITVIGFLLTLLLKDASGGTAIAMTLPFKRAVLIALFGFGSSIACSLLHKFFASDGMYHHIRAIKVLILYEQGGPKFDASNDEEQRDRKFTISEWGLNAAAFTLGGGAISLAVAFGKMLLALTGKK